MKPIKILSVDFEADRRRANAVQVNDLSLSVFKTFTTPDGKKTLDWMDAITSGSLVDTNVHMTVANAARRDLVTDIHDMITVATKELSDE